MTLFVFLVVLLLAGVLTLLYFPWQSKEAVDRDSLNRALYQSRLRELEQENVADREAMVVELQRTLLTDIPESTAQTATPLSRWTLLPGAVVLVVLSVGIYLKTSDLGQVLLWKQAERQLPVLLAKMKDPNAFPLRMDEIIQLRLGLRSQLEEHPDDLNGWEMLGQLGLLLNDGETAIGAYARAYQLAQDDPSVILSYTSVLLKAGDAGDVKMAGLLLRDLYKRQPHNLSVLELLVASSVRSEDFPAAVEYLKGMLALLPENNPQRSAIEKELEQAQARAR